MGDWRGQHVVDDVNGRVGGGDIRTGQPRRATVDAERTIRLRREGELGTLKARDAARSGEVSHAQPSRNDVIAEDVRQLIRVSEDRVEVRLRDRSERLVAWGEDGERAFAVQCVDEASGRDCCRQRVR